ncbi:MAG: 4-hydroxybenzoyl-CoA reductase [Chloroflexi bacterium]|nr:MAG: 4-hydroxybenzoyl-CoA reductase [Chloroflexota bacterium]
MLRLPRFRIATPRTYREAAQLLRDNGAGELDRTRGTPTLRVMLVAGGTDLFPNMKRRQFSPEVLVSLARVRDAARIHENGKLEISAGTTLTEVAGDQRVRDRYTALAQAAELVSTPQLRNMGTIGGNVCLDTRCNWYDQSLFWRTAEGFCMKTNPEVVCRVATSSPRCLAVASADTVPALLVLGASAHLQNAEGEREVALADLYREDGIRAWAMRQDEVLTEITLPRAEGWRSTYLKLRDRGSFDFPIAGVGAAVRWDGGTVREARIAVTALGSRPLLVEAAREALVGTRLDDRAIGAAADAVHKAARPMDNTSGTISQRKVASRVLTERALVSLRDPGAWGAAPPKR